MMVLHCLCFLNIITLDYLIEHFQINCSTAFSDFGKFSSQTLSTVNPLKPSFKLHNTTLLQKVIENEFTIFLLLNSTLPTVISSLPPLLPITTSELHSKKVLLIPHDISNNFHQIFHKNEATEKKPIENYGMVFFFHHEE